MARIRYLKPDLFLDEDLGALSGDHMVLFTALWTQADREGRLEDRPARIKAATFPYRAVDVEALLADLERVEKVVRYEADGVRVITIPGFLKHQRPHPKEVASALPPPPSREKTRQEISGLPSIPSSPGRLGTDWEQIGNRRGTDEAPPAPPAPDFLQTAWNSAVRPPLPEWKEFTDARKRSAKARWKEHPEATYWRGVVERIAASDFCRGQNDRGWIATPDWLLQPDTAARVLEGKYDNRARGDVRKSPIRAEDMVHSAEVGEVQL